MVVCKKKQGHLNEAETNNPDIGDQWDHSAIDAESKLAISLIPGKRTEENTKALVADLRQRSRDNRPPKLVTTDNYKPYKAALLEIFGHLQRPPRRFPCGRKPKALIVPGPNLRYAVVQKTREKGRVVKVERWVEFGDEKEINAILEASTVSKKINTAYIERYNGTDRHLNSRKARKTYRFSKKLRMHEAMSFLTLFVYNFLRAHRSLRLPAPPGGRRKFLPRTPAMAAGLTDHIWTTREILSIPVPGTR